MEMHSEITIPVEQNELTVKKAPMLDSMFISLQLEIPEITG